MAVNNLRERRTRRDHQWPAFDNPGPKNPPAGPPPSGGVNYDQPDFYLPFTDMGAGRVRIAQAQGSGEPTFTRATTATTILSTGLIASVASGVPRSYYSPAGVYLGYLAEGARTNLCIRSEEFDNAAWVKNFTTVSADATAAPDGATTADKLVEAASTNVHCTNATAATVVSGSVYTISCYMKLGEQQWNYLNFYDGTSHYSWFDLTNGVVGTNEAGNTSTITAYPNGWYRATVTRTVGSTSVIVQPGITTADNDKAAYLGDITKGTFLWGVQLELGAFSSSYIPTTTAAVTRNADNLIYPVAGNLVRTAGTAHAVIASSGTGTNAVISAFNGTGGTAMYIGSNNLSLYDGTSRTLAALTQPVTSSKRLTTTWGSVRAEGYVNGVQGAGAVFDGSLDGGNSFCIGDDPAGGAPLFGAISDVKIFNSALPAANASAL